MIENNSGWKPVGRAVLLRAFELLEKQNQIIVPDAAAMSSATCDTQGIVVAIGADAWKDISPRCKIEDKVMFTKFTGGVLKGSDGFVYRMIPADAIYAVKENTDGQ